jgi:hypothetical protein
MRPRVGWLATVTALACAAAVAGCGIGPGPSSAGTATLTVTRDFGSKTLVSASEDDPRSSETVIRFLDDEADITTRYGGGFVQSINGIPGGGGSDWFFYVNGIESPVGAAEVHVEGGDRIWWDYRDWSGAMRVPAVVGSWPEPFEQFSSAKPMPVRVYCFRSSEACSSVRSELEDVGIRATVVPGRSAQNDAANTLRILVGPWRRVGPDPAVGRLYGGPARTGVFALFKGPPGGPFHLIAFDAGGTPVQDLGPRAGLVAAVDRGDDPPTWIVTGQTGGAVKRAAASMRSETLRNRYAVAATGHGAVPLPIAGKEGG